MLKRISAIAERTQCAVILVGHMNKAQGLKSGYRGLGSIDFRASARSVLLVGRLKSSDTLRVVRRTKTVLRRRGRPLRLSCIPNAAFSGKVFAPPR